MDTGVKNIATRRIPTSLLRTKTRQALRRGVDEFLAFAAMVRASKAYARDLLKASSVTVVRVPEPWSLSVVGAIKEAFDIEDRRLSPFAVFLHPIQGLKHEDTDVESALKRLHLFVVTQPGVKLLPEIEAVASADIVIDVCADRDLIALGRLRHTGSLSPEECHLVRQQPIPTLGALFRPGRAASLAIRRLCDLEQQKSQGGKEILSLETLPGLGSVGEWGRELAVDIDAWRKGILNWSAIDRGLLLYGPPGTGKTIFANALAKTCKMNFISASLAKWQANGHLGDLLKAMRKSFSAAKNQAPAILFIDEIDSIGDREQFLGEHVQYHVEVVNGLLELLDGSEDRDGVIVIGACNDPKRIDKAILRSGRLEKHVFFDLPDKQGRREILCYYFPELGGDSSLDTLAERLEGWSQADFNRLSRQARKNARHNNRQQVIADDIFLDLPEKRRFSSEILRRFALHEAGHAVCALATGRDLSYIDINLDFDAANKSGHLGITMLTDDEPLFRVKSDITRRITIYLAGIAAEQLFLDQGSTSGGGGEDGDLENATSLAHSLVASFGLCQATNP